LCSGGGGVSSGGSLNREKDRKDKQKDTVDGEPEPKKSKNTFLPATKKGFAHWKKIMKNKNIDTREKWRVWFASNPDEVKSNSWPKDIIQHFLICFPRSCTHRHFEYAAS